MHSFPMYERLKVETPELEQSLHLRLAYHSSVLGAKQSIKSPTH